MTALIHPLADVQSPQIGEATRIWQFVVVLPGARIGRDCNICSHCLIENEVVIGDRVTVKSGVQRLRFSGCTTCTTCRAVRSAWATP